MSVECSSLSSESPVYGPRIIGRNGNIFGGSSFTYKSSLFVKLLNARKRREKKINREKQYSSFDRKQIDIDIGGSAKLIEKWILKKWNCRLPIIAIPMYNGFIVKFIIIVVVNVAVAVVVVVVLAIIVIHDASTATAYTIEFIIFADVKVFRACNIDGLLC